MNCEKCGCEIGGWESICEECEKQETRTMKIETSNNIERLNIDSRLNKDNSLSQKKWVSVESLSPILEEIKDKFMVFSKKNMHTEYMDKLIKKVNKENGNV